MALLFRKYKDMSKVMAVVCSKTSSYFHMWKQVLNVPLIFISAIMSVLNSNVEDPLVMRYMNIICNLLTAILIGLSNQMKFTEKANMFHQLSIKFSKLEHAIEQAMNINDLTNDKLNSFVVQYDSLTENIENIPNHIKNKVKNAYNGDYFLPIILNGDSPSNSSPNSGSEQYNSIVPNIMIHNNNNV